MASSDWTIRSRATSPSLPTVAKDSFEQNAGHVFIGNDDEMTFLPQKPRLLLFRFDGSDWVARGFVPFFQSGEAGPRVRVLASADGADATDRALRAVAARYLRLLVADGLARAATFDRVPFEEVAQSRAFAAQGDVGAEFGGSAADYGRAAD